jgi:hypothetical protein
MTATVNLTSAERDTVMKKMAALQSPDSYREYVTRYEGFSKKSAESFISVSETVVEAERTLTPAHFEKFCNAVHLIAGGSTYKKIKAIGENASRFKPFLQQLPHSWTTLYMLAVLPADQFDRVAESGVLTPMATAKELKEVVRGRSGRKNRKPSIHADISLDLRDRTNAEKVSIYDRIVELSHELGFGVAAGRELNSLLGQRQATSDPLMASAQ